MGEPAVDSADILKRVDELLSLQPTGTVLDANASELLQGCTSLLSLVYGQKSSQLQQFTASIERIPVSHVLRYHTMAVTAQGTLKNIKREIEAGLTGSLRHQIASEVLTDLIQLARTVLNERGDGAKNVAAVLTAAAFEDTIRRMGETFAGVIGKDDLSGVLTKLKDADVMKSPQVGIAQSYLSFRNHALHANWEDVQLESVHSVLGFVEQLLLKHFI
jgi:hypothetical protein